MNTTGSNNIALGILAGSNLRSGSNNIFLGNSAGSILSTESNNICIGASGNAGDSNTIRIGSSNHSSLYVPLYNITSDVSNNITSISNFNDVRYSPLTNQLVQYIPNVVSRTLNNVVTSLSSATSSGNSIFDTISVGPGTYLVNYSVGLNTNDGTIYLSQYLFHIYVTSEGHTTENQFGRSGQSYASDIIKIDNTNNYTLNGHASHIYTFTSSATITVNFQYTSTNEFGSSRFQSLPLTPTPSILQAFRLY
jgi:hypothetical protein